MSSRKHIIRQQVLELSIASDMGARDIQEEVSDVFRSRIIPRMEQLFDRLSEEGQVLKIDKLELNLGDVNQIYLKEELPLQVERMLEEEIIKLLYQQREGIPGLVQAVSVVWSDAKLEAFQYLLRTGVHAWTSTFKDQSLAQLFAELSMHSSSQTREVMKRELSHDYVRNRIAYQFNESAFESLIYLLSPAHSEVAIALTKGLLLLGKRLTALSKFSKSWEQQAKATLLQVITFQGKEPATTMALVQQVLANLLTSWKGHLRRYTRNTQPDATTELVHQIQQALRQPEIKSSFKQAFDPLLKFMGQQVSTLYEGQKMDSIRYVETKSSLKSTYQTDLQGDMGGEVTQKIGEFTTDNRQETVPVRPATDNTTDKLTKLKNEDDKAAIGVKESAARIATKAANAHESITQQTGVSEAALKLFQDEESEAVQASNGPKSSATDAGKEISRDHFSETSESYQDVKDQSQGAIRKPDQAISESTLDVDGGVQVEGNEIRPKQNQFSAEEREIDESLQIDIASNETQIQTESAPEEKVLIILEEVAIPNQPKVKEAARSDRENSTKDHKQGKSESEENATINNPETIQEKSLKKATNTRQETSSDSKAKIAHKASAPEQESPLQESSEKEERIGSKDHQPGQEISGELEQNTSEKKAVLQPESDMVQPKSGQVSTSVDDQTRSEQASASINDRSKSEQDSTHVNDQSATTTVDQKADDASQVKDSKDSKTKDPCGTEIDDSDKASDVRIHDPLKEDRNASNQDQWNPSVDADSLMKDRLRPMNRIVPHPEDRFVAPLWRKPPEIIEEAQIGNAGLALLWPYLPILFKGINWVKDGAFVSEESQFRAIHFLQYMATGAVATEEQELTFNKLLVGMQPEVPVPFDVALTDEELEEAEHLLQTVLESWKALKSSSVDLLRHTFLQKEGLLKKDMASWKLFVERSAFDILLDRLPWSYSVVKLPWMDNLINVEW